MVENENELALEGVGTFHGARREAEAVIFVLGAPNPQQIGARGMGRRKTPLLM